jgi:hypothetical protein
MQSQRWGLGLLERLQGWSLPPAFGMVYFIGHFVPPPI